MLLSDHTIRRYLGANMIVIDPLPDLDTALGACSIDLTLSDQFFAYNQRHPYGPPLDPYQLDTFAHRTRRVKANADAHGAWMLIMPNEFCLASTVERLVLPNDVAGRLEGRSSLARLGLAIHSTAGMIDPGWDGTITLELSNVGPLPIVLRPGMRVCAIAFEQVDREVNVPYIWKRTGKYAFQQGPRASKIAEDR